MQPPPSLPENPSELDPAPKTAVVAGWQFTHNACHEKAHEEPL
ncbi:hypothetical protein [Marinagarivorans cellulosilyticus]|nr:hypothetical protein [Marinagarivorans cellulosilyticus]